MRYRLRHALFAIAWLSVVLAAYQLDGRGAAAISGIVAALLLILVERMILQWRMLRPSRFVFLGVALAATIGFAALTCVRVVKNHRENAVSSAQFQTALHEDRRFQNVVTTYTGGPGNRGLTLSGSVASQQDLQALEAMADDGLWHFKTDVRWNVGVVPRQQDEG